MICPNCGSENKEGYKFCSKCGTRLQTDFRKGKEDFSVEMWKMSASINRFESEKTTPLNIEDEFENEETVILSESGNDISDFENDETVILSESKNDISDFENDETVILSESGNDISDFENDETVILSESKNDISDFENDETVIFSESGNDISDFENDETVILSESKNDISDFENEGTMILNEGDGFKDGQIIKDKEMNNTVGSQEFRNYNERETPPAAPKFDYRSVYKEYRTGGDSETAYIDHLRRLKELLDDGIITEDEFTRKKQQILGI